MIASPSASSVESGPKLFHTLRSKILVSFGLLIAGILSLVSIFRTFGIPFFGYVGSYGFEETLTFRNLGLIADLKKDRLVFWLAERKMDARLLADSGFVRSLADRLLQFVEQGRAKGRGAGQLRADLMEDQSRVALTQHLSLVLNAYSAYHKIEVADPQTRLILASIDEQDVGEHIVEKRSVLKAMTSPQGLSIDLIRYPLKDKTYLVIHSAIPTTRTPAGDAQDIFPTVLSMYVDTEDFLRPLLYLGRGLGETGDIVLVNQDRRILMSLKYPLPDGTAAQVLEYQIETELARLATAGGEGVVTCSDYRGVPVLAAYRHIMVTPDVGWGMVVKRDKAEVFGPIWRRLIYSFLAGLGGIFLALVLMARIASGISRPVEELTRTASQVEAGSPFGRVVIVQTFAKGKSSRISLDEPREFTTDMGGLTSEFLDAIWPVPTDGGHTWH